MGLCLIKGRSTGWGLAMAFACLAGHGAISPSAHADTLSWQKCAQMVSSLNPAIHSAEEALQAAHDQALSDRGAFLPQISGSMTYNYANSTIVNSGLILGGSSTSTTYTASVNASQNLFNGLQDLARQRQDAANIRGAEASLAIVKAQQSYNLMSAYENLVYAEKSVGLAVEIQKRREQNLALVELRFRDGQENKGSVLLYEAYLKDAKFSVLKARDNVMTSKTALAQAIGADEFMPLEISGPIPLSEPGATPDFQKLVAESPTHLKNEYTAQADEAQITQAQSAFFPTLGLNGSANKSGETFFPQNDLWSVGITLSIPLFNGGRDYYSTKGAGDNYRAAIHTERDTDHQTVNTMMNDWTNYIEAVESLNVDRAYLEASQVRARIARANYNNGLTSFQDWDLTETDLITRETSILQAEVTRVTSEASWNQIRGVGVIP